MPLRRHHCSVLKEVTRIFVNDGVKNMYSDLVALRVIEV
jgi:hypothetical protein